MKGLSELRKPRQKIKAYAFLLASCLLIVCSFFGCSGSDFIQDETDPVFIFSAKVDGSIKGKAFTAIFSHTAPGVAAYQTGAVSFYWTENGFSTSAEGLSVQREGSFLPGLAPANLLESVFDGTQDLKLEHISDQEWAGVYEGDEIRLWVNRETGVPERLEIPALEFTVAFSDPS